MPHREPRGRHSPVLITVDVVRVDSIKTLVPAEIHASGQDRSQEVDPAGRLRQ